MTYDEALEILRKAKRLTPKQSDQINTLACRYMDGCRNLPRDREKAVTLYRMAAEKGDSLAEYNLGWCYYEGKGVEQNDRLATEWYRKSAEHGDVYEI